MIDLHNHSTCSDGSESPARVVELAAAAGLSALALTDHDGLGGLVEAEDRAQELGITLVPGCEVSCRFSPGTMHVLCYFVRDVPGALQDELANLRDDRERRNERLLERLSTLGISLSPEELAEEAGSAVIGRPHFAALLVRRGVVSSIQEAFDRYLAKGAPAYVRKADIAITTILELVGRSGGVAVLAHPLSLEIGPDELSSLLAELAEAGLSGLECYYGRYSPAVREELAELARRHELVATGGSDFHGSYKPDLSVGTGTGDLAVPERALEELLARRPSPAIDRS